MKRSGWLIFCLLLPVWAGAQNRPPQRPPAGSPGKPAASKPAASKPSARDTAKADAALPAAPADAVSFFAADSAAFLLGDSTIIDLYGKARLDHSSGKLSSETVRLNPETSVMEARGGSDTDTLGRPLLERGSDQIKSTRILYNYKTGKGKFEAARVNISEGALQGEKVKRADAHVVYVADGMYSTCTLDHPHFYIRARKMKVVNEEEIFFTRARLYLLDIPYPLLIPFGYVPAKWDKKRSGPLAPVFMNQSIARRGYGLNNLGWFQYFNDYLTGTFAFGAYTSGTWNSDIRLNYAKNGRYSGSIGFAHSTERGLEPTDPDFSSGFNRQLVVRHQQTLSPWSSFNADVNLRTADYYRRNSTNLNQQTEVTTRSSAGWNYSHPSGAFSLNAGLQHNQNFDNNQVDIGGPNVTFTARRLTPFQRKDRPAGQPVPFYESLAIGYSNSLSSYFTYRPTAAASSTSWLDVLFNPALYRSSHDFTAAPVSRTTPVDGGFVQRVTMDSKLLPGRFLQMNGNMSFNEYWYPSTIRKSWDPVQKKIVSATETGFASARDYSAGVSFNTTVYGISNRRIGMLSGFRHTARPSVSFTYRPDFSKDQFGYYRSVQADSAGTKTQRYSRFEGSRIGAPGMGEARAISLSLDNILETKLSRRDTTGEQQSQVIRLIDNFRLSASYNFAATSKKLSPLNASASSNILRNINLNMNAAFTFYTADTNGVEIDRYLWEARRKPFRMTQFSVNTGTRFSEGSLTPSPEVFYHPQRYDPLNQELFGTIDPLVQRRQYVPWDVPWSFGVSLAYSWSQFNPEQKPVQQAALNINDLQFLLTPKWRFATSLGYDFISKDPTPPQFTINRNLHCWDLSLQWAPYGPYKYFLFSLNVNSGQFRNLFQKLPGLNNLNSSSGRTSRF